MSASLIATEPIETNWKPGRAVVAVARAAVVDVRPRDREIKRYHGPSFGTTCLELSFTCGRRDFVKCT
jgi:hypothetical protein